MARPSRGLKLPADRHELVERSIRLIYKPIRRFLRLTGGDREELESVALVGLVQAAIAWDGIRAFSTLAVKCITNHLLEWGRQRAMTERAKSAEWCAGLGRGVVTYDPPPTDSISAETRGYLALMGPIQAKAWIAHLQNGCDLDATAVAIKRQRKVTGEYLRQGIRRVRRALGVSNDD